MDADWAIQSSIAHNSKLEEYEKYKRSDVEKKFQDAEIVNLNKQANIQYNMIKPYE